MTATTSNLPPIGLPSRHPESGPPPASVHPPRALRGLDILTSLLGLVALGGAVALGSAQTETAARLVPSVVLIELGALALTAPALIALHQFMRLAAEPEALAGALGRALVHGGRVAAGLAVVALFFSATTNLWAVALLASLVGVGVFTSATACVQLQRVEADARREQSLVSDPKFTLLVTGWLILSWIIALRVGVNVGTWVLGL